PVEGRIVLREAATTMPAVRLAPNGDCIAAGSGGSMHSRGGAVFDDVELARAQLLRWARQPAAAHGLLARARRIGLAEQWGGRRRLGQVVRADASLRTLQTGDAERLVESFGDAARRAALRVPITVDTVGMSEMHQPVFVGLMPEAE